MKEDSINRLKEMLENSEFKVQNSEVEVGNTYPIYGFISGIIDETPGNVTVEINYNIVAKLTVQDIEKIELIKERAFEPGIFLSKVVEKNSNKILVECSCVVFGRQQHSKV